MWEQNKKNIYAVDGTYNIDEEYKPNLNLSIFDVNGKVPIDLTNYGSKNRNKEILCFKLFLKKYKTTKNKEIFKDCIFIFETIDYFAKKYYNE